MSEAKFQEEVLKSFRALGWYATHLSPPSCPGWEDVIALHYPYGLVLELKEITPEDHGRHFKSIFTKAQMPRYLEQLSFGIKVIWIAVVEHMDDEVSYYHLIGAENSQDISFMRSATVARVLINGKVFRSSDEMVEWLIRFTKDRL